MQGQKQKVLPQADTELRRKEFGRSTIQAKLSFGNSQVKRSLLVTKTQNKGKNICKPSYDQVSVQNLQDATMGRQDLRSDYTLHQTVVYGDMKVWWHAKTFNDGWIAHDEDEGRSRLWQRCTRPCKRIHCA